MPTSNIFGYTGYGFGNKIIDYEIGIDTIAVCDIHAI